ncbi:ArnT family glycosyltransferase [Picosynechococcus sp. PCC 73109]|uniref:ArnT family glycosyltransferase n=1 Tax=Picosynechococcus sp. PCC 73109 TaxID=374982 RepID=UPI0007459667|nr:glycosyltransferase family 39 protein [Picosynechococcus sp. PCC 73109]AMA08117.1 dolichyl-phosphate-mannose--protein mannosyltransferase [Picosynechococcus sp. PCC 73109]
MSPLDSVRRWYYSYEKFPKTTGIISAIALGLLGGLAFFWHLGAVGLVDETEPMFADAARRMLATGDWITPYYNDATRFDKPPLVYWLMAIAYKIVGVNAWGARLPSAFAALGLMVLVFVVLRQFGFGTITAAQNPEAPNTQRKLWLAAWIGSSLIALNLQTIVWARQGVSDMLLNGCFSGGLICFFYGYGSGGQPINRWLPNSWYMAAYALFACAVLTKGPVGIVVPGLVIMLFLLYVGKFREVLLGEAKPLTGALIFTAIALPWFVLVTLRNGQAYIDSFFGYHNFDRFTGVVNGHDAPWYFYFPVVLVGFLPWSVYLPAAIARLKLHRPARWRQEARSTHLAVFASIWFGVIFGFFTIAVTKLPSYTIPLLPAAAILVALFLSHVIETPRQPSTGFRWSAIANVGLLLILSGFMIYSPQVIGYDPAAPDLATTYAQSNLAWWGFGIWLLGAVVLAVCVWRSRLGIWLANGAIMVAFIVLVLLPASTLLDQARQASLREIADTITAQQRPDETVMMVGFEKPSLVFYTGQDILFIDDDKEEELAAIDSTLTQANSSFLLVVRTSTRPELPLGDKTLDLLLERSPYELLRVQK